MTMGNLKCCFFFFKHLLIYGIFFYWDKPRTKTGVISCSLIIAYGNRYGFRWATLRTNNADDTYFSYNKCIAGVSFFASLTVVSNYIFSGHTEKPNTTINCFLDGCQMGYNLDCLDRSSSYLFEYWQIHQLETHWFL